MLCTLCRGLLWANAWSFSGTITVLREKDALPCHLRAERLETIPIQQRLTGNRQDVPSPQAAHKLKQIGINNRNDYTVGEQFQALELLMRMKN